MYEIERLDGSIEWMNERIIMKISPNDDGTYTLTHFNYAMIEIKSFKRGI
jgi:uncharacterized protein YlzI (FlbEa/FlbD family)